MFEKRINQSKLIIFIFQNTRKVYNCHKKFYFFILKHLIKKLFADDSFL